MWNMWQEILRGLFYGAVGSAFRWLGRLLRNALIAFVVGGGVTFGLSTAIVWLAAGRAPDTASWLLMGAIAISVACLSALGTMIAMVARSLGRMMRPPRSGPGGGPWPSPPTTPRERDNVRSFPTPGAKRRAS